MLSFISYFIYLALGLGAFFLVRRFAKGEALYLLSAVLFVLCLFSPDMNIWGNAVSMNVVFVPILFLCMIVLFKDNEVKTRELFFKMLIVLGAVFLVVFVGEVILACQGYGAISWFGVGSYISLGISLTTAMYMGKVLYGKLPHHNYIFNALFLLILTAIDAFIYSILRVVFVSGVTFKFVFLSMLFSLMLVAGTSFIAQLVNDFLLPRSYKRAETKDEEVEMEEVSQEAPETKEAEPEHSDELSPDNSDVEGTDDESSDLDSSEE